MLKSRRIKYKFYTKEKTKVKESFKFLFNDLRKLKFNSLIDVGCSNGSFVSFLNQRFRNKNIVGADIDINLLNLAKKRNKNTEFIKLDITKKINNRIKNKFDIVIMSGIHTIFDDIEPLIKNAYTLCRKNGYLFIFGSFNPTSYDIITRIKSYKSKIWQKGFNRPSLITTKQIFKKYFSNIKIKKFIFNLEIKENKKDPTRTYTLNLKSNRILTVNGLEQISTKYLVFGRK